jgi:hypothetical protein
VKSSKSQIQAKFHKIPMLRFEDQKLTSFSGLIIYQILFRQMDLKERLRKCFDHLKTSPIFGRHLVVLLLVVHLLLGFRRLREIDYYRDDPLVLRLMGLKRLPDVATISRTLSSLKKESVEKVRELSCSLVLEGLKRENLPRLTLDFDGSVQSTKGHAEGTAVGYNKNRKGSRSYYPLFCTVAQTGQFFDVLHRAGNVHDSNGADTFILDCLGKVRSELPGLVLESRLDSAFFSQKNVSILNRERVRFTISVPFERYPALKGIIERRKHWHRINAEWSFFESNWKPASWDDSYRFLFIRKKNQKQTKGPLQLHLFEPRDFHFDYKVIVTNKTESAKSTVLFHNGRGSQEALFGDAKNDAALDSIPSKTLFGNQLFTLCAMMAHNLTREVQILANPSLVRVPPKRSALWSFERLDTIRHRIIQRAGRLTMPQGNLTLTLSANQAVQQDLLHFIEAVQKAA